MILVLPWDFLPVKKNGMTPASFFFLFSAVFFSCISLLFHLLLPLYIVIWLLPSILILSCLTASLIYLYSASSCCYSFSNLSPFSLSLFLSFALPLFLSRHFSSCILISMLPSSVIIIMCCRDNSKAVRRERGGKMGWKKEWLWLPGLCFSYLTLGRATYC